MLVFYVFHAGGQSQMKYASARQKFIVLAKTGTRMILAYPDARLHENNNGSFFYNDFFPHALKSAFITAQRFPGAAAGGICI